MVAYDADISQNTAAGAWSRELDPNVSTSGNPVADAGTRNLQNLFKSASTTIAAAVRRR